MAKTATFKPYEGGPGPSLGPGVGPGKTASYRQATDMGGSAGTPTGAKKMNVTSSNAPAISPATLKRAAARKFKLSGSGAKPLKSKTMNLTNEYKVRKAVKGLPAQATSGAKNPSVLARRLYSKKAV